MGELLLKLHHLQLCVANFVLAIIGQCDGVFTLALMVEIGINFADAYVFSIKCWLAVVVARHTTNLVLAFFTPIRSLHRCPGLWPAISGESWLLLERSTSLVWPYPLFPVSSWRLSVYRARLGLASSGRRILFLYCSHLSFFWCALWYLANDVSSSYPLVWASYPSRQKRTLMIG